MLVRERQSPFEVRTLNGRYFTYFCRIDEAKERFLYQGRPAGGDVVDYHADTIATTGTPMRKHPLACTYDAMSQSAGYSMVGNGKRDGFRWVTWINDTFPPFHTWKQSLSTYRADDIEEAEAAFGGLANRVIAIGDEIWLETGMPCIKVTTVDNAYVFHDIRPDLPTDWMFDQYFPLDRGDEALQYAARFADGKEIDDLRLPVEIDADADFAFDHEEYRAWRQAQMLAIHCKKCVVSGNKGKLATTDDERGLIETAYLEAAKFNPVVGTKGRPEDHIYEVTALASRFDRKWFPGFAWGGSDKRLRKRFLAETLEMFDNRPVHIFRLGD
jgi:hypothetical protein